MMIIPMILRNMAMGMMIMNGKWGNQHSMVVHDYDVLDHGNEYADYDTMSMMNV